LIDSSMAYNTSSPKGISLKRQELTNDRNRYEAFIENTLQPEYQSVRSLKEETEAEIKEYRELSSNIAILRTKHEEEEEEEENDTNDDDRTTSVTFSNTKDKFDVTRDTMAVTKKKTEELESLVDLGHQIAYSRAIIPDPTTIFVHVGMGFHVEFKLGEAIEFIDRRLEFLEKDILERRTKKVETVRGHLNEALGIMDALEDEFQKMGVV